jgi:hypothetical protein
MCEAVLFDSASFVMVGSHVIRSDVKITLHVGLYVQRKIILQIAYYLLGAFAKLRKATVRFVVSVSVRMDRLPLKRFS